MMTTCNDDDLQRAIQARLLLAKSTHHSILPFGENDSDNDNDKEEVDEQRMIRGVCDGAESAGYLTGSTTMHGLSDEEEDGNNREKISMQMHCPCWRQKQTHGCHHGGIRLCSSESPTSCVVEGTNKVRVGPTFQHFLPHACVPVHNDGYQRAREAYPNTNTHTHTERQKDTFGRTPRHTCERACSIQRPAHASISAHARKKQNRKRTRAREGKTRFCFFVRRDISVSVPRHGRNAVAFAEVFIGVTNTQGSSVRVCVCVWEREQVDVLVFSC